MDIETIPISMSISFYTYNIKVDIKVDNKL